MSSQRKIVLLPMALGEQEAFLSPEFSAGLAECELFYVENPRTSRRFLSQKLPRPVQEYDFIKVDKRTTIDELKSSLAKSWKVAGYLSEAGLPCVADPGNLLVQYAHTKGWEVVPVTGPSSIFLTLMSSGLNGQNFAFLGYLPKKGSKSSTFWREVQQNVEKGQTQLFMDTPYRSQEAFAEILKNLPGAYQLCIGMDLHNPQQFIQTKPIEQWKKSPVNLKGRPVMFAVGSK